MGFSVVVQDLRHPFSQSHVILTMPKRLLRQHHIDALVRFNTGKVTSRSRILQRSHLLALRPGHVRQDRFRSTVSRMLDKANANQTKIFRYIIPLVATTTLLCCGMVAYPFIDDIKKAQQLQTLPDEEIEPFKELQDDRELDLLKYTDGKVWPWPVLEDINSIRLATINVVNDNEIHVGLSEHSLRNAPKYEAISYCWTTSSGTRTIKCNGISLDVTKSVFDALQARSKRGTIGYMWVDTLCISQVDVEEKNSQVQKIGQIFAGATHVWAYAGEPPKPLRSTSWRTVDKHSMVEWLDFLSMPYFERLWIVQEICNAAEIDVVYGQTTTEWKHIVECVEAMHETALQSGLVSSQVMQNVRNIMQIHKLRKQKHQGKGADLFDLVVKTSHFKTTNPRDKIFALLSLANDISDDDWELFPDYGASEQEIYRRFTMWLIARKQDLRILSLSSYNAFSELCLPSWIPDLSVSDKVIFSPLLAEPDDSLPTISTDDRLDDDPYFIECTPHRSYADGILRPLCLQHMSQNVFLRAILPGGVPIKGRKVSFSNDNSILELRGAVVDQLEDVGEISPFGETLRDTDIVLLLDQNPNRWQRKLAKAFCRLVEIKLEIVRRWLESTIILANSANATKEFDHPAASSVPGALWLTLTTNRQLEGEPVRIDSDGLMRSDIGGRILGPDVVASMGLRPEQIVSQLHTSSTLSENQEAQEVGPSKWTRYRLDGSADETHPIFSLQQQLERGQIIAKKGKHILETAMHPSMLMFMRHIFPPMAYWFQGRRFGITRTGRFVAAPAHAQAGDIVAIFLGSTVPYVLRSKGDGTYWLVGECYVHGIMYGGAVYGEKHDRPYQTEPRAQWVPRRTISIR